jgi:hypothetical protein
MEVKFYPLYNIELKALEAFYHILDKIKRQLDVLRIPSSTTTKDWLMLVVFFFVCFHDTQNKQ